MSIYSFDQRRRLAAEQAAGWLAALEAGKLSARERGEFIDWLRESPLHIAEMLRIARINQALTEHIDWSSIAAAPAETMDDPANGTQDNVVTLADFRLPPERHKTNRIRASSWASAAGFAALVTLGTWFFFSNHNQSVIRTQVGERRELTLADGSVVDVAPATELRVILEDQQRMVKLTRGQAFFHVAKDANRPFIVEAGTTRVRAVGTAFDVSHGTAGITVTVVEGRVAVSHDSDALSKLGIRARQAPETNVVVSANEQVVVTPAAEEIPVREVDGATEVAWTEGNLIFNNETVAEVVRRFNQYNRAQIYIQDPGLASRRVSGVFETSDPESFIEFVKSTTGDEIHEHDVIRLDMPSP